MNKTAALASLEDDFHDFDCCPLHAFTLGTLHGTLGVLMRGEIITEDEYELAHDWIKARLENERKRKKQ